ncbi:hypothetical protein JNUCC23_09010 [Peribacillus sp. JNUCC 23]
MIVMTVDELEEHLAPHVHTGKIETKTIKRPHEIRIDVIERDDYVYEDDKGKMCKGRDINRPYSMLLSRKGVIGYVEHPYKEITAANKTDFERMTKLIGTTVKFD